MKCASFLIVTVFLLPFLPSDGFPGQNNAKPKQKGSCCSRRGPPGFPGGHGVPGIKGYIGAKGESGVQGPPGPIGPTGVDGINGPKGSQGEPGLKGDYGPKGEEGREGDPGFPGQKGEKGNQGPAGSSKLSGIKGQKGDKGDIGLPGDEGPRGDIGYTGVPGVPGVQGRDGLTGSPGRQGYPGDDGFPGQPGNDGLIGPKGLPGEKGKPGTLEGSDYVELITKPNWKQCAWRKGDGKDKGLIQECTFNKRYDNTSLRVFYGGNLGVSGCSGCCKRWYFTFNKAECRKPMTIEGIVYLSYFKENTHRHREIEGYCNQVPKGQVRVGFWVGNCVGYKNADAYSGWNSASRIVIEEVPPSQA